MIQTINKSNFIDAFKTWDTYANNFTYEGLGLLFDYFEQLEDDTGEQLELDVVAICCDYSEDTYQQIIDNYDIDVSDCDNDELLIKDAVMVYLVRNTSVVGETNNCIIYQQF